ncbi:fatty acid desaturase [Nocardioides sp. TRM66260-LWL]|uniref:fatty acid desaturase n=1 Tax=Nocardioides sp. TRM66260-LWL TaxID=2874478 RepID=UPI0021E14095|nr:fatty acid desaturase [Nocardioides sp. TRM66260-LWL]
MTTTPTAPRLRPVLGLPDPAERVPALAWPTAALYAGSLALFGVELLGLARGWTPWLLVPLGGAVTYLMFTVLHESVHHAVSTRTRLNDAFGRASVPFVAPYAGFALIKFIHIEHHRNTNEPKSIDPDQWTSEGPAWQLPLRWATLDVWYLVFYLGTVRTRPRREVVSTFATFLVAIAALGGIAAAGYGAQVLLWLAGQRLGILVLAWWFDYLPHHGLPFTQREHKYGATRVRVGREGWMTPLFVYQNYHLVHHLHPSVPFYRYVRAWRRNEQAYLDRDAAISTWFGRSLTADEYRTWRRLTEPSDARVAGSATDPAPGEPRAVAEPHALRVRAVEALTAESRLVTFEVPDDLAEVYAHRQGQHVTLRAIVDGRPVARTYSIVDAASPQRCRGTLSVAVRHVEGGVFSTYVRDELAPGDLLDVLPPAGHFRTELDATARRRYVAVAAGSGVTPILSIARTVLAEEPHSTLTVLYGNRTSASTMFRAELDALADASAGRLEVHHVLSRADAAAMVAGERPGRIDAALARELAGAEPVDAWFLCGPQILVDHLATELGTTERVLTEVFHAEAAAPALDVESRVTIAVDGTEATLDLRSTGDTLLDAALQAGLEPPYSCAGGACGTCRAKVVLGRAVMDQNHALGDAEIAAGYVLTCQAHPVSEEVRVEY